MPKEMVFYARQDTRLLIHLYTRLPNHMMLKMAWLYEDRVF